ncbi:MAG: T9SS type A sorting domain-containing protein [Cryomorphaceae bacterium]|nr:T9SS type A sorting domain-containing protein [Flavobacteriales bacterium]
MKSPLHFTILIALIFGVTNLYAQEECTDYKVYYMNIIDSSTPQSSESVLYGVDIEGGSATLTELETFTGSAHMGISPVGDLYIVAGAGKLIIYDPATGDASAPLQITQGGEDINNIPHVVVDPADGVLYVASANTNTVYSVDPITGEASTVLSLDVDVRGGDLVITSDGILWLANRGDNTFYNISAGGVPGFTVDDLNNINGAGILADGTIIVANAGSTAFNLIDPITANISATTYEAGIVFENGDIAAGCVSSDGSGIPGTECYASEVLLYAPEGTIPADRMDPTKALGAPQRDNTVNFATLGFNGTLILSMDGQAQALPGVDDLEVVETTFGNKTCSNFEERADVYVSQQVVSDPDDIDDSQFVYVGQSCTNGAFFDVFEETGFSYFTLVKIVDVTPEAAQLPGRDGYDVDGVVALNGCEEFFSLIPGDCFASEMFEYVQGIRSNGGALASNRTNPTKALGEPERTDGNVFVTLGYGGSITLGFNGIVPNLAGDDLEFVETSFGNSGCEVYPEYADVYVSQDGVNFLFAKTICKSDPFVDISDAGPLPFITAIKLVNNGELSTTFDAYDLDGVLAIHNCSEEELNPGPVMLQSQALVTLETFPNPSTGPVNIEFMSSKGQLLIVEVIDMNGRVVETIFRQTANAGQEYRLGFEGSNLPNGVYITKLTTPTEVVIRKILIAR